MLPEISNVILLYKGFALDWSTNQAVLRNICGSRRSL